MEARGLPGLRGRKTIAMAKEYTVHLRGYRLLENIRNLTELATYLDREVLPFYGLSYVYLRVASDEARVELFQ